MKEVDVVLAVESRLIRCILVADIENAIIILLMDIMNPHGLHIDLKHSGRRNDSFPSIR